MRLGSSETELTDNCLQGGFELHNFADLFYAQTATLLTKKVECHQYIRMIPEGSCHVKIQFCHHGHKLHFEIYFNRKQLF